MKKILFSILAALSILTICSSCNKDDGGLGSLDLEKVDFQKEIIGTWNLVSYVNLFNGEIIYEEKFDYPWNISFTKDGLFYTSEGQAGAYKVKGALVYSLDDSDDLFYQIVSYDGNRAVCQEAILEVDSFDIKNPVATFKGQKIYKSLTYDDTFVYLRNGKTPVNCYTGAHGEGVYYEEDSVLMEREK